MEARRYRISGFALTVLRVRCSRCGFGVAKLSGLTAEIPKKDIDVDARYLIGAVKCLHLKNSTVHLVYLI